MTTVVPSVSLRPVAEGDRPFLLTLYGSTRKAELDQVEWLPGAREAFLAHQLEMQHRSWRMQSPEASFSIVVVDGEPAGRLYVDRRPREIRIIDIALMPDVRRRGVGTRLLTELIDESGQIGAPLAIHVERFNPALHWYARLGFVEVEDRGVYLYLERPPQAKTA